MEFSLQGPQAHGGTPSSFLLIQSDIPNEMDALVENVPQAVSLRRSDEMSVYSSYASLRGPEVESFGPA
ncbi:MAG TPA: hypothetical protein VKD91_21720 [Pyrinomonadaceae bacterium]|nr:hypothetical protein [Pyrinomonadaceae bacterium]